MPWHKWKSKGTSRWSIPWRCQSAPAAQKAQTPVPVTDSSLDFSSSVAATLSYKRLEHIRMLLLTLVRRMRRDGPCVHREGNLDTPTPDINCRKSWGVHIVLPLTSLAVTVRGSSVVGRDVIWLPYFQSWSQRQMSMVGGGSCRLEVRNNKRATARGSWFYFFFSFGVVHTREVVLPSRLFSLSRIVTSHSDV